MIDKILNFAEARDDIRSVKMTGSRTNPNIELDEFCDYDIAFKVINPDKYLHEQSWIMEFGELIIMQQNEFEVVGSTSYIFLMLFKDGFRIDLTFYSIGVEENREYDSLEVLLLDKDNLEVDILVPSEQSYYVHKPTDIEFTSTLNNFFWCSTNIAKGICRRELCYVKSMFDEVVKVDMHKIVDWYIGMKNNWQVNPGKFGKWYSRYLTKYEWDVFKSTYAGHDYEEIWNSLFKSFKLVNIMATAISEELNYKYCTTDEAKVYNYLNTIRSKYTNELRVRK